MSEAKSTEPRRVLVLGATGMLGSTLVRLFSRSDGFLAWGTVRRMPPAFASQPFGARIIEGVDAADFDTLVKAFSVARPHVVINAIGLVKQLLEAEDPLSAIPINALLPHRLARLAAACDARFVHISTDCVFSGRKGMYSEADPADATDLYGRSKLLGEVDYPNAITLRTSIIGHEIGPAHGLVGWFLAQESTVRGYRRAIFSGLPTVELGRVIRDHVLARPDLHGVYHVSAEPIPKYDLLGLVADVYGCRTRIVPDDALIIDRSLDSSRFRAAALYSPASWPALIKQMHEFQ